MPQKPGGTAANVVPTPRRTRANYSRNNSNSGAAHGGGKRAAQDAAPTHGLLGNAAQFPPS